MNEVDKLLLYMEYGKASKNPPAKLIEMVDQLRKSPKDYLAFWKGLKEFQVPMLMRTSVQQHGDKPTIDY